MGLPIYNLNKGDPTNALYLYPVTQDSEYSIELSGPDRVIRTIQEIMQEDLNGNALRITGQNAPQLLKAVYSSQFIHRDTFIPYNLFQKAMAPLLQNGLPSQNEEYACIRVGFNTLELDIQSLVASANNHKSVEQALTAALYFYSHNAQETAKEWVMKARSFYPRRTCWICFTNCRGNVCNA